MPGNGGKFDKFKRYFLLLLSIFSNIITIVGVLVLSIVAIITIKSPDLFLFWFWAIAILFNLVVVVPIKFGIKCCTELLEDEDKWANLVGAFLLLLCLVFGGRLICFFAPSILSFFGIYI